MTRETHSRSSRKGTTATVSAPNITISKQPKKEDRVAKLDKLTEKLIKVIKFEVEVQKSLAISSAELHKKRLLDITLCLN